MTLKHFFLIILKEMSMNLNLYSFTILMLIMR